MKSVLLGQLEELILQMNVEQLQQAGLMLGRRLGELVSVKTWDVMRKFDVGEIVKFKHQGVKIVGKIIKMNQKTVTVCEQGKIGNHWNVSPSLLRKVK